LLWPLGRESVLFAERRASAAVGSCSRRKLERVCVLVDWFVVVAEEDGTVERRGVRWTWGVTNVGMRR
jgi:hypothetical protein